MKTFTKNYIGKDIKVENMDIVKVTLRMEDVQNYKHVYQDCEYITFEVAKMQQADKFGRTHTAYVSIRENVEDEKTKKSKKKN